MAPSLARARRATLALLGTVALSLGFTVASVGQAHADTSITIDGTGTGRTFDGIGAISGGGGNSRLLMDYPPAQRAQILDYLFTPGYGADLQILKVEIGGDTNSTDGSESSIEHTQGTINCDTGYEWWLMEQAKARNPNIKLYGLAWGAPGWVGSTFWTTNTVNYLVSWLDCAKSHGLTVNYLGGWNERGYDITWYENLRAALNSAGYGAVQIVGADSDWSIANDLVANSAFSNAVQIVGAHYPCGYEATTAHCTTTANALATGKQLWASENGSEDYNTGAAAMIQSIVRGYLDAKMTAYINWPLIAAIYPNLPYDTTGLMVANQPWSGNYSVGKQLWATAQVTQFTKPGWQFVDQSSGYLGGAESNGTYATLKSPNGTDYSTVIETTTASAAQSATFAVTGGLSTGTVHVWATNVNSSNPADWFTHAADITPTNGSYSLTLQPGYIYTVTTTTGQGKGTAAAPARADLALPYKDNFDADATGSEAAYLSDQQGSFEVRPCHGRAGQCVRQMAAQAPVAWDDPANPYTLIGDLSWQNYTVSADAMLEQPGSVQLIGRAGAQQGFAVAGIDEYYLQVSDTGAWSIVKNTQSATLTTLASGTAAALGTHAWHRLGLTFDGSTITASIDGTAVGSATDASYASGQVGLGVDGYQTDEFDNLSVTPIGAQAVSTTYELVNRGDGLAATASGGGVGVAATTGAAAQQWQLTGDRNGSDTLTNVATGAALALPPNAGTGATSVQWAVQPTSDGYDTVTNAGSHLALDVSGTAVVQRSPDGGASQDWSLVQVPVSGATYVLTNVNSGQVLDISGQSTAAGGKAIQWPYHGSPNEWWTLTVNADGSDTLTSVNSAMPLEVPGSSTTTGTQLDQGLPTGAANQHWNLTQLPSGAYTLTNVNSGLLADVTGASQTPAAAVIQWTPDNGTNQQWTLSLAW